jgi:NADH:ubiquinone oxidoreductase subunit 6 (subunit J)
MSLAIAIILFLCLSFVGAALFVLLAKRLTWTISAIGIGSVSIAVIFFLFGARYAGAFELSVGVGLVSVLFIIGSSLVQKSER